MTDRLRSDVASAIRALSSTPAPVIWSVATLAVAIGLNLAMYNLADRALFSPPPGVVRADRLFTLGFVRGGERGGSMTTTSFPAFSAIGEQVTAAEGVAAFQRISTGAVVDSVQIRVEALAVSSEYFDVLRAQPLFGPGLPATDAMLTPSPSPVVISHALWTRAFGADRGALGRTLTVRGREFAIAGVMPAGFSGHSATRVDVWIPMAAAMQDSPGWQYDSFRNLVSIVIRVKDGESVAAATNQATAAVDSRYARVALTPVVGAGISDIERRILYCLGAVSLIVLLIGLANTATLLLVRGSRRRHEMAIRVALGATRGRLATAVFLESLLLAAAGIVSSLMLASWLDEAVRRELLPSLVERTPASGSVLGVAALAGACTLAVALAVGVLQLPSHFRDSLIGAAARGNPRRRVHRSLLVVQATLSVVLLAGAGVFGRSLLNLVSQDFGMRLDGVVLVEFDRGPGVGGNVDDLFKTAIAGVRQLPGVEAATLVNVLPFSGFHVPPMSVPGRTGMPNVNGQPPFLIPTTPELFDVLGLRVTEGRRLTEADGRGTPVVLVNESMARGVWPGESAIGKCIRIGFDPSFDPATSSGDPSPSDNVVCRQVVGVVRDVRQRSLVPDGMEERLMQYFVPFAQVPPPPGRVQQEPGVWGILLRTSLPAEALAAPVRSLVAADRTDLPFLHVRPYASVFDRQVRPWRLGTILLTIFGALALGVAAMGLYAAFAHMVHERRHEMAVRIAIGARPAGVLLMILREAAILATVGIVAGSIAAVGLSRWVESMFFGTAASDPIVLGAAALLMIVAALGATFAPALGAARADPNVLLRSE